MSTNHLLIVLGKRLNKNILTVEGRSRVRALHQFLLSRVTPDDSTLVVAFCGGITRGQMVSEAEVMHDYYYELVSQTPGAYLLPQILLEKASTNTVENIKNVVSELKKSDLLENLATIKVTFVSNDYHLQRIFEIQNLMDEQGLLRVFKDQCSVMGVELEISQQLEDHVVEPYPYSSQQGQLFILMDALTTYRVYLEGVVVGAFRRDLETVRCEPAQIALDALKQVRVLLMGNETFPLVEALLPVLQSCIEQTDTHSDINKVREHLALLDVNLTLLNRYLDPEVDHSLRWWR